MKIILSLLPLLLMVATAAAEPSKNIVLILADETRESYSQTHALHFVDMNGDQSDADCSWILPLEIVGGAGSYGASPLPDRSNKILYLVDHSGNLEFETCFVAGQTAMADYERNAGRLRKAV